jgi:hypothetical protein
LEALTNLRLFANTGYQDRREKKKIFQLRSKHQGRNDVGNKHHLVGFRVDAIYK